MEVSVAQAAEIVGVGQPRIRSMIASGHLAARRTGRQWLIERSALPVVPDPTVGRPLSARSCWAILATLQGDAPEGFSRSELARARQRAGEILAVGIRPGTLAGRAAEHPRYASPAGLGGLLDDDRIVRSGVSAADDQSADIVAIGQAEAYVRRADLDDLDKRHGLLGPLEYGGQAPNIMLRVCGPYWPFAGDQHAAPGAVVAVDLIDSPDERTRRAGHDLLSRLLDQQTRL